MTWYAVAIKYTNTDSETKVFTKKNMSSAELFKFREMVYTAGLFIPNKDRPATEGVIISPFCIGNIDVYMQANKFE